MKNIYCILSFCLTLLFQNATGQITAAKNIPPDISTQREIPAGPGVYGVFEGRSPCAGIAELFGNEPSPTCIKVKWRIFLYHDSISGTPTTYKIQGRPEGKWKLIKGMPGNPAANIIVLETQKPFYLLKGDENVLFMLDENKNFRVGNANFSYTLNRVRLVRGK
jgi:hypothetical protein